MTINEYQTEALRTAAGMNHPNNDEILLNGVMGLCGESGECVDMVKKYRFQGHELDKAHLCWLVCSTTSVRWTTTSTRSLPKLSAARKSETIPSGNTLWTLCSRVTVISRLWCWHSISSSPRRKSCVFAITWELSAISPNGTIIHEQCINIQMFCGHTKPICSLLM